MGSFSYPPGGPPADLLVEGTGSTIEEAVANVALAMFNAITPIEGIRERETFTTEAHGDDAKNLLFNILDELLYLNDTEGLVARSMTVDFDVENLVAKAVCRGERFSASTHEVGIAVKAVTYHMMSFERNQDKWKVRVVFDT
jgi:SHS2 domain-containing protein